MIPSTYQQQGLGKEGTMNQQEIEQYVNMEEADTGRGFDVCVWGINGERHPIAKNISKGQAMGMVTVIKLSLGTWEEPSSMYAIHATVGEGRQVPTFYLNGNVQGIVSEEQAADIAATIVNPFGAHNAHVTAVKVES